MDSGSWRRRQRRDRIEPSATGIPAALAGNPALRVSTICRGVTALSLAATPLLGTDAVQSKAAADGATLADPLGLCLALSVPVSSG